MKNILKWTALWFCAAALFPAVSRGATYSLVYSGNNNTQTVNVTNPTLVITNQTSADPTDHNVYVFGTSPATFTSGSWTDYNANTPILRHIANYTSGDTDVFYWGYTNPTTIGAARFCFNAPYTLTYNNLQAGNVAVCIWGGGGTDYYLNGNIAINGELRGDMDNKSAGVLHLGANLSGSGTLGFTKSALGGRTNPDSTIEVSGNNANFSGAVDIDKGKFRVVSTLGNGSATNIATLSNGGQILFATPEGQNVTISTKLAGSGNLTQSGKGSATLASIDAAFTAPTVTVSAGVLNVGAGQTLKFTNLALTNGTTLGGAGTLDAPAFDLTNGTITPGTGMTVASAENAAGSAAFSGDYTLAGTFGAASGKNSTATVNFTGGSVVFDCDVAGKWSSLADGTGANATGTQSGGSLYFKGTNHNFMVGKTGTAAYTQTNGSLTVGRWLNLGYQGTGTYNISGNSEFRSEVGLIVGEYGTGNLNISENAYLFAKEAQIGHSSGGTATALQNGGTLVSNEMTLWSKLSGTANHYTLSDGKLYTKTLQIGYGRAVNPVLELKGGEFACGTFTNKGTSSIRTLAINGSTLKVYDWTNFNNPTRDNLSTQLGTYGKMDVYGALSLMTGTLEMDVLFDENGVLQKADQINVKKYPTGIGAEGQGGNLTMSENFDLVMNLAGTDAWVANHVESATLNLSDLMTAEGTMNLSPQALADIEFVGLPDGYTAMLNAAAMTLSFAPEAGVPEPAAWLLLLCGLGCLWMKKVRQR